MSEVRRDDKVWNDRRNLRAAYDAGADVIRVANEAFNMHTPSLYKALVLELAHCEYIKRRENIIALGNSGRPCAVAQ